MYKNFKREFDASIEALNNKNLAVSQVCEEYINNLKTFTKRIIEARRDMVLSKDEYRLLFDHFFIATEMFTFHKVNKLI